MSFWYSSQKPYCNNNNNNITQNHRGTKESTCTRFLCLGIGKFRGPVKSKYVPAYLGWYCALTLLLTLLGHFSQWHLQHPPQPHLQADCLHCRRAQHHRIHHHGGRLRPRCYCVSWDRPAAQHGRQLQQAISHNWPPGLLLPHYQPRYERVGHFRKGHFRHARLHPLTPHLVIINLFFGSYGTGNYGP